jgi:hypothetical protein
LPETAEDRRLAEPFSGPVQPWRKWGPYVAERAWGTVREDYSADGSAWDFFPHDLARSKTYRWGEDAIAGLCDRYQLLVLGCAFWNGRDPILKERLFGLTNREGNHGEDVKEYWFYLDNLPTHSYMRMLYKYPQGPFPYSELVRENARPDRFFEYELLDTGIFKDDRYFDIFVEYAKASPEDIHVRIEAVNRGPEAAPLHIIPQLWFRNTWSWQMPPLPSPEIRAGESKDCLCLAADDSKAVPLANLTSSYSLGQRYFYGPTGGEALFTDNETNAARAWTPGARDTFAKDAFHRFIVDGEPCVNPDRAGTKACLHYSRTLAPGESVVLHFRLTDAPASQPLSGSEAIVRLRRKEADEFYESIHAPNADVHEREIQRRALAGMLWSKQAYLFDVHRWLEGDSGAPPPAPGRQNVRNNHWRHLNSMRILAVPDRWEYPWFAAWDLAFACVPLALVDPGFAKDNLWFLLFEQFQHPNGQIPAYEWDFSDLNPPVHAWACWRVYNIEKSRTGKGDRVFLEKCFHKLLINFAWWVNRVDSQGNNVFEGGFLGMDNITVVDRSSGLPGGTLLEQSDATGWMAFFCLNLMRMALELAHDNPVYESLATKFFEHFMYIGAAMQKMGGRDYKLWDEEDGFFYDVLRYPNGEYSKFRVRSLVGLVPLFAVELLDRDEIKEHHNFLGSIEWFMRNRPDLVGHACSVIGTGKDTCYLLSVVNQSQFARVLRRLADPGEFLSPAGLRSLSKFHLDHPFRFGDLCLKYEPAEAEEKLKGGNSNWRGPVWFPTTYLLIESLLQFGAALGPDFSVTPPGETAPVTPRDVAQTLANRLIALFKPDEHGRRPCYGGSEKFQRDPHWRDHLLFHEYFHGDNGAGLGATHQTGWTGLVANLIAEWRR